MASPGLDGLRDVDDVHGSFLLGGAGELLGKDLPAVFTEELFSDVGPRLARLRETLEADGQDVTTLVLRFSDHKLHVRTVGELLLCVITGSKVNGPALRMAMNLVARHAESAPTSAQPGLSSRSPNTLRSGAPTPAPPTVTSSPPSVTSSPPSVTGSPPSTHRREVLYRGRRPG